MMKTPKFWLEKNFLSFLVMPLSLIYYFGFCLKRFFTKAQKVEIPVICIGNISAGGAGKTPTAIAIGKLLQNLGVDFCFLTRGYFPSKNKILIQNFKNKHRNSLFFNKITDSKSVLFLLFWLQRILNFFIFRQEKSYNLEPYITQQGAFEDFSKVGDEAILLSEIAPVCISRNRFLGAKKIADINKFQAIVLDDGLQNFQLKKDFSIVVIDSNIGFGNEFLIPAGPLRQSISSGLRIADLIVIIGEKNITLEQKILREFSNKNIINAEIISTNISYFLNKKLIAFCGLGYPQKFFSYLKNKGLEIIQSHSFPDHYFYQDSELETLCNRAKQENATLITTKKDWVKFNKKFQEIISYLEIDLEFQNKELIIPELKKLFKKS